jgi:hypothetical protein
MARRLLHDSGAASYALLPLLRHPHRALCPHIADHSRGTLTDTPKFCSTDREELSVSAEVFGGYDKCSNKHCFGG